jgi:hypothetical protein
LRVGVDDFDGRCSACTILRVFILILVLIVIVILVVAVLAIIHVVLVVLVSWCLARCGFDLDPFADLPRQLGAASGFIVRDAYSPVAILDFLECIDAVGRDIPCKMIQVEDL